jgi:hypothetical protein
MEGLKLGVTSNNLLHPGPCMASPILFQDIKLWGPGLALKLDTLQVLETFRQARRKNGVAIGDIYLLPCCTIHSVPLLAHQRHSSSILVAVQAAENTLQRIIQRQASSLGRFLLSWPHFPTLKTQPEHSNWGNAHQRHFSSLLPIVCFFTKHSQTKRGEKRRKLLSTSTLFFLYKDTK